MWPMYVDYSEEDCKKVLRSLELEAYSTIINAFRAQGSLTKERKKMLQEFSSILNISLERHRAEIRRALNDEHLNTIAEKLFGPNTASEWAIEGRRVVPLMQRHAPQTVFTEIANSVASAQAAKNASLLHPGKTGSREVSNGVETMACRKRKDFSPPDYALMSPHKVACLENQTFNSMCFAEHANSAVSEPSPVPESYDNISVPEAVLPIPLSEINTPKNAMPPTSKPVSPSLSGKSMSKVRKEIPNKFSPEKNPEFCHWTKRPTCRIQAPRIERHPMLKTSTVTTFSSFDQMTSNLSSSKVTPPNTSVMGDHSSSYSEHVKAPTDQKTSPRPVSMKSSTVVIPTSLSSSCTTTPSNRGHLPTPPASSSSSSHPNNFVSPMRSKTPNYTRQNLPAGLGIKLSPQTQVTQRPAVPQKSLGMKPRPDSPSFFSKKPVSIGFDNQFQLPSSSESLTITKSPMPVTRPATTPKSEVSTKPAVSKTPVAKTTLGPNSQYISRSLFSAAAANKGGGAKPLPPVIFNVGSTSSTTIQQTPTKTTGPVQSEAGKNNSPQLLPKTSTGVGVSPSHVKINTSTTQTIQYRNDGGLVRSARISNVSQPTVGSRLPCAISPSAISALGLPTNISSLRVTIPAGSGSSVRVSPAAKPNVIVVHKAQMWPRSQQPAVVMGSSTLTKLPGDIKPDKSRPLMSKAPRAIAPSRPHSPAVSSTLKTPESAPVMKAASSSGSSTSTSAASSVSSVSSPSENSSSEPQNSKVTDSASDAQCKRNLLADIIEASGILSDKGTTPPKKSSMKEKNNHGKNSKDLCNNQEPEVKISPINAVSPLSMDADSPNPEANTTEVEGVAASEMADTTLQLVSQEERNGVEEPQPEPQAHTTEAQTKESVGVVPSTHVSSEFFKSSECSKVENDVVKEKDS